jgi:hypothetical protein
MKSPITRRLAVVLAATVAAMAVTVSASGHDHASLHGHDAANKKAAVLHDNMRALWEDHIVWTRMVIVSFAADGKDFDPAAARLLANQVDIGNAIAPYYGRQAGKALTRLLQAHILGAVPLLKAAKAGDAAAFDKAKADWYANGDEIAGFLSKANPRYLPLKATKSMMRGHLDQTIAEAAARLGGDWDADIRAYDKIHRHILMMSDAISSGIVKQFPAKFR